MSTADRNVALLSAGAGVSLAQELVSVWDHALAGDSSAQSGWEAEAGSEWLWQREGVLVKHNNGEWSNLRWQQCATATLAELKNFVVEVTISGNAEAAGLSFGDFKDFLATLDAGAGPRHLQLEVDLPAERWAFRIDGQLQDRFWWDSSVRSAADLIAGTLTFKARRADHVLFQNLSIHTYQASCELSVIMTCHRFLQRLRVSLRNWCEQSMPCGSYEVLVVNPHSPDGTHEHLAAVASSYPHMRVREVLVGTNMTTNKSAMINSAVRVSRGEWIWLTDADCLFAPTAAAAALEQVRAQRNALFYGQRRHLSAGPTAELLAGRLDGLREFEAVERRASPHAQDNAPWGYTQIVHRSTLERVPYRESINQFAHSDSVFIDDCRRRRILPVRVGGLCCLHLDHPFAWHGTDIFL